MPQIGWEEETRRTEIRNQHRGLYVGAATLLVGLVTAAAAVWAAKAATEAVGAAQDAVLRSSREQRLSSGIESMGGSTPAQRIAGISLLTRSVTNELNRVDEAEGSESDQAWDRDERDATAAYISTVDALENYVGAWTGGDAASTAPATPAFGQGIPPNVAYDVPKDVRYAANGLKLMTSADVESSARRLHTAPAIDLNGASLATVNLGGLNVGWITLYAPYIDLRDATLTGSSLGAHTTLSSGHLQCARLIGVDLRGTDLAAADLRGADLTRARLRGANLAGADLTGAVVTTQQLARAHGVGSAHGLDALSSAPPPASDLCMARYGAVTPKPTPTPTPTPAKRPRPRSAGTP